jgi:adenylyltransferase/sulfurtransferase
LLESFDIVVDCTDRPLTRYLLSDASVLLSKTLVSGAAISTVGQWAVYGGISGKGKQRACYRCMWPSIIGDGGGRCDELGVWGSTVGLVGVAMAGEVLKVILGQDGELTKNGYTSRLLIT